MRIIRINRLFHGMASVRDYLVKQAKDSGEGLIIQCNGEKMTIPHERLGEGIPTKVKFQSKHGAPPYGLIDYTWVADPREASLF